MEKVLTITGYKVENLDDLRQIAPAAFSGEHNRSKVYSFAATTEILENLSKLGWVLTYAKQQGNSKFSRHIIRLTNTALGYMPLKNDQVRPQIILDNSHNGGSSAQLHMGLFRMVCQSELVICIPNLFNNIKFRHMGLNFEELKVIMNKMTEQYQVVGTHISEMQDIILSKEQQLDFAKRGAAYRDPRRYINDDGTINEKNLNEAIDPIVLLEPMRGGDRPSSLWDTFQIVREWLTKGGFIQKSEKNRNSRSKAINNAVRQIALNKTLWLMAEEYLNKPLEAEVFEKLTANNKLVAASNTTAENGFKIYTTAKGVEKKIMVIAELEDGRTQVKDLESNSVFSVPTNRIK